MVFKGGQHIRTKMIDNKTIDQLRAFSYLRWNMWSQLHDIHCKIIKGKNKNRTTRCIQFKWHSSECNVVWEWALHTLEMWKECRSTKKRWRDTYLWKHNKSVIDDECLVCSTDNGSARFVCLHVWNKWRWIAWENDNKYVKTDCTAALSGTKIIKRN